MFTGLIEAVGIVRDVGPTPGGRILEVQSPLAAELGDGDSVAVSGVCLTVTSRTSSCFQATISPETMRVTTLGSVEAGDRVNLERPLKFDGRLGGHFVLGHVDGVGRVAGIEPAGTRPDIVIRPSRGVDPFRYPGRASARWPQRARRRTSGCAGREGRT